MSAWTVVFFDVTGFRRTACGVMRITGALCLLTGGRVNVLSTKLFATGPTPGTAAASADHEAASRLETACKNIVAGGILEGPPFAPGALFGVGGHVNYQGPWF